MTLPRHSSTHKDPVRSVLYSGCTGGEKLVLEGHGTGVTLRWILHQTSFGTYRLRYALREVLHLVPAKAPGTHRNSWTIYTRPEKRPPASLTLGDFLNTDTNNIPRRFCLSPVALPSLIPSGGP